MNLNHITINVIDEEKTLWFYETLLELKKLQVVDMGDSQITYFQLPNDVRLELIKYYDKKDVNSNNNETLGKLRHLAFTVENVEKICSKMKENKIKVVLDICELKKLGNKVILVNDPNGVEIEFCEAFM